MKLVDFVIRVNYMDLTYRGSFVNRKALFHSDS